MAEMTPEMVERIEVAIRLCSAYDEKFGVALQTLLTEWRRGEERVNGLEEESRLLMSSVLREQQQSGQVPALMAHLIACRERISDLERSLAEAREELRQYKGGEHLISLQVMRDNADLIQQLTEARERIAYLESEDSEWVPIDMHRRVADERDEAREKLARLEAALAACPGEGLVSEVTWDPEALAAAKGEKG